MATIISSQRYLDDSIVDAKRDAADYECVVSPLFQIDGEQYKVLLDGHHSYAAAVADGVAPVLVTADATDHDAVSLLDADVGLFLEAVHMGSDYYDLATGKDVW
jgi:hypothetical protein